ncbi:hypothetical protein [Paenibacillus tarimensis]|uniref:hypothetical protein n=1 Tax=Paenibacillus tarimensis TaxID=416012 RepID=UPI001F25DA47|nr:hypothetical protein [Paenibacillus tarimensis]MCF2945556.1 hypothetical protein [Paenibacillus tarimensis]
MPSITSNNHRCPEQLPTPVFSSPVSPLEPAELDLLQRKIAAANQVLQALGNPRDPQQLRAFQLKLNTLQGQLVVIKLETNHVPHQVRGCLQTAGRNYVQLLEGDWTIFIPYNRIKVLEGGDCVAAAEHTAQLACLTDQERWSLIRQFGCTVSGNVNLLNIFFGIELSIGLIPYRCFDAVVMLENGTTVKGSLGLSRNGQITLFPTKGKRGKRVNLDDIIQIKLKEGLT